MEPGQASGIPTVGLDPVARALRDERGCHHVAAHPHRGELALEVIARRTRFVAGPDPFRATNPLDQAADRVTVVEILSTSAVSRSGGSTATAIEFLETSIPRWTNSRWALLDPAGCFHRMPAPLTAQVNDLRICGSWRSRPFHAESGTPCPATYRENRPPDQWGSVSGGLVPNSEVFSRSLHNPNDLTAITLRLQERPRREGDLWFRLVLVHPDFNDGEKSTASFSSAPHFLFDETPLFLGQMAVLATQDVGDPPLVAIPPIPFTGWTRRNGILDWCTLWQRRHLNLSNRRRWPPRA
jgi:hypothetical protein